ncbi:MAG: response regulator, partial [Kiritimatiellae bacterium]|nr:response regulator [Kiritimatiellia bacterium]
MAAETQYKILILEDRPEDCELVQRVLSQEGIAFVMHRADTEKDMLKELRHFKPDIIISDYVMPGFNALKALDIVLKAAPETPFIVVSGTVGEETAADAIRSGASDYVMKDNLKRLGPAIRRELDKIERRRRTQQVESDLRKRLQNAEQMETLGKMAGKVAHDLNNIIGPLVAYPDLILDQLPPESPVRDDILEIRKAAEHAAEMIKDLLTLARRGNFHAVSVDLNVVV